MLALVSSLRFQGSIGCGNELDRSRNRPCPVYGTDGRPGGNAVCDRRTPAPNSYELLGMQRCSSLRVKHQYGCGEHSQKECRREKFAHVCYHQNYLHSGVGGANERQGSTNQPVVSEAPQHDSTDKIVSSPHEYVSHHPTSYFLLICSSH